MAKFIYKKRIGRRSRKDTKLVNSVAVERKAIFSSVFQNENNGNYFELEDVQIIRYKRNRTINLFFETYSNKNKYQLFEFGIPFHISDKWIQVLHCCEQNEMLDDCTSTYSTEQKLKYSILKFLLEKLESLKEELKTIYPKNLTTIPIKEKNEGNKYFRWLGWEYYYLVKYYAHKATDNSIIGIDFPDFVNLLTGKKLKEGQLEWYGSKSVLNAFFKDLHLLPEYLEKDRAHPIIAPIRKSLNIHEVFYLPNTDPKHQSKAFSLPINPKDISGRDVKNQQIFEPKKENVVVKSVNGNKLKPHQRLVLELLGIDLPQG